MSETSLLVQIMKTCEPLLSMCEACGESFACGANTGGCWCAEIKLSDAIREELRAKYQRCLCRACLEKLAAASSVEMSESGQGDSELGTSC